MERRDASLILFLSIIETYERLRQLDFLYRSFRESVLRLHRSENVVRLRHLNMLLNQDEVAARVGSAISMSPFDQVKIVITEGNDFVRRLIKEDGSHEILSASIATTVELLAGPVRSVRIDENTHVEILQVMLDVLHGSVQDLLDSGNKDGPSSSVLFAHAVTLCSYALESSNHCRFWFVGEQSQQNNLVHYKIPRAIQAALDAAVDRQNNSVGKSLQHEIQFLACQRIRQLHAEMLETESISFAIQQAEDAGHSKIAEARRLAAFVLDSCFEIDETFQGWLSWWTLADSLPVWAPGHQFMIDDQSSRESRVMVQISCGIAMLRELRSYNGRWMGIEQVIREIETKVCAQECLMSRDFKAGVIWTNSLLLVGEGLRFASTRDVEDLVLVAEDQLVRKVIRRFGRETTSSVSSSIAYLFSCPQLYRLPHYIKNDVIEEIISSYLDGNFALLTPLFFFVKQLEPSELDAFLEDFLKRTCGLRTLLMIEMYHALMLTNTDLDLVEVKSKYSTILFSLCLQLLAAPHAETSIRKASSLIIEISSRRDVGRIHERDIGIILSSVATALENSVSFTEKDSPENPINAYNACYSLVSFFLPNCCLVKSNKGNHEEIKR